MTKNFCDRCSKEIFPYGFRTIGINDFCMTCAKSFDHWFKQVPTDEERLHTALCLDDLLIAKHQELMRQLHEAAAKLYAPDRIKQVLQDCGDSYQMLPITAAHIISDAWTEIVDKS